jgi:hypothetical protein
MTPNPAQPFDPRATLAALQATGVTSVLIGGLARVARGADEITRGVDICPSLQPPNLARLQTALEQIDATRPDGQELVLDSEHLDAEPVITLATAFGELKLIAAPAGVPRGYDALHAGASSEHLGGGLRPEIASTGDSSPCPPPSAANKASNASPGCAASSNSKPTPPRSSNHPRSASSNSNPACHPAPRSPASSATSTDCDAAAPAPAQTSAADPRSEAPRPDLPVDRQGRHTPRAPRCPTDHTRPTHTPDMM